jgi:hypothetical protein
MSAENMARSTSDHCDTAFQASNWFYWWHWPTEILAKSIFSALKFFTKLKGRMESQVQN